MAVADYWCMPQGTMWMLLKTTDQMSAANVLQTVGMSAKTILAFTGKPFWL